MDEITIGDLTPSEWEFYKNLRLQALKEEPQAYGSSYEENSKNTDDMWKRLLEEAKEGEKQWLSFAKNNGIPIGMVGAFKEEVDIAHIVAVFVDKKFRGQGIAKKLMDDIITKIKKNKSIKKLIVEVNTKQEVAVKLYKSVGFVIKENKKDILGDGKEYECLLMEMKLDNE